ncbi:MAG: pro-sigmaK processing inhibitor BofA family protein, partial [Butyrivibrio sp.]|nr:pro-sigmaK processing inhibitor BofA family protein [Butyrivibrio sp.]
MQAKTALNLAAWKGRDTAMEKMGSMAAILGVCVLVLAIGALGRKIEWIINFVLRAVLGTIGIYFLNNFLVSNNILV